MMPKRTRIDLDIYYHQVVCLVAKHMKIIDWEWKSVPELVSEINMINSTISDKLGTFIQAYEQNQKLGEQVNEARSTGTLTEELQNQMNKAIETRDATRNDLINEIKNL